MNILQIRTVVFSWALDFPIAACVYKAVPKPACNHDNFSKSQTWRYTGENLSMTATESRNKNLIWLSEQFLEYQYGKWLQKSKQKFYIYFYLEHLKTISACTETESRNWLRCVGLQKIFFWCPIPLCGIPIIVFHDMPDNRTGIGEYLLIVQYFRGTSYFAIVRWPRYRYSSENQSYQAKRTSKNFWKKGKRKERKYVHTVDADSYCTLYKGGWDG